VSLKHNGRQEKILWTKTLKPVSEHADRGIKGAEVIVSGGELDQLIFETQAVKDPVSNWAFWRNVEVLK